MSELQLMINLMWTRIAQLDATIQAMLETQGMMIEQIKLLTDVMNEFQRLVPLDEAEDEGNIAGD